jgi:hypothetical protein
MSFPVFFGVSFAACFGCGKYLICSVLGVMVCFVVFLRILTHLRLLLWVGCNRTATKLVALSTATSSETGQMNFNNRSNNGGGGGGGRSPMLKLQNPLKIQRIAAEPPQRRGRREQSDADRNNNVKNEPVTSVSSNGRQGMGPSPTKSTGGRNSSGGGPATAPDSGGDSSEYGKDGKRKRQPGSRKKNDAQEQQDDSRNRGKTSLRLGTTGRKSRAASLTSRRGSLRKRDRTAEREAKAEAAEQRRTVSLPECVQMGNHAEG